MMERKELEISISREFEAPRALVFANWADADHLGAWFAPQGCEVVDCSVDLRVGGRWRITYRSNSGEVYIEHGEFLEVDSPRRIRFTLVNENERREIMASTEVHVELAEHNDKTTMRFIQTGFASAAMRDAMTEGWKTCLNKLSQHLAACGEMRALFCNWFDASGRKDLDASMSPIAGNVISYEHEAPLAYHGIQAVRAICKEGFNHMPDNFRWDVPDLRIVVRGDVAFAWGLNRMAGPGIEMWSRGTRIFQKMDGRWQMIHQHVSFPYDSASGAARLDLRPPASP